jgi:hypothetical protein
MELIDIFKLIADEFKDIGDDVINSHLELADRRIAKNIPDYVREEMVANLAAHRIDIALRSKQASGAVSSISEGKLSIVYNVVKAEDSLDTTKYGTEYKQLLKSCVITPMTRVC